ncbi:MAG TPA: YbdK family carboxylate-amine ligase [Solirubrobacteraceae bacterium]|jgi:carboxylate-amine ligase
MTQTAHAVELPSWSVWRAGSLSDLLTIGIEEEFMLLNPRDWSLAYRSRDVLACLPYDLRARVTLETHAAVMEIATGVHRTVAGAVDELAGLRRKLACAVAGRGLRVAVAGTHPAALWKDTVVTTHPRYRHIGQSMRVLARREPTLATHVHVGVPSPHAAVELMNRLRAHLPLLLALSANSPFWQGRPTGFASTRTTLFDAFPRSGVPRAFSGYADWVATVDRLLRSGAIADPSFLWWDIRLQPRYGTVEVRIPDAQTTVEDVAAVAALVHSLARLELERPGEEPPPIELIQENRFLAARDGMDAHLIDAGGARTPAREQLARVLADCAPAARRLGCRRELAQVRDLAANTGAERQLASARGMDLRRVATRLADAYEPVQRRVAAPEWLAQLA